MLKNKKAFTLVELLVAMAIIGVLIGLAIFGLAAAQRVQRDTERKSVLDDMSVGMQVYYEKYNSYPTAIAVATNSVTFCGSALVGGACPAASNQQSVPLKGSGASLAASADQKVQNTSTYGSGNATTNTGTAYCLQISIAGVGTNPGGYVFCAGLENQGFTCTGTGAVKGNTLTCSTVAITIQ